MRKFMLILLGLLLMSSILLGIPAIDSATEKLNEALIEFESNDKLPVYIVLKERYDSVMLYNTVKDLPKPERRKVTINTLKNHSNETQKDLKKIINELEANNLVSDVRYLWIINIISFNTTYEALQLLDNQKDIDYIQYSPAEYALMDTEYYVNDVDKEIENSPKNPGSREITYNVDIVNAPAVWDMGYEGEGIVVAVLDTGVNYNHEDIRNNMWIHPDFPNYGYNFTNDSLNPMDDHSHGTHCAGTVAGDGSAGSETGMAPSATIMALKVLTSSGNGQHDWYFDAVQFALEYEADVISVSLGWRNQSATVRREFRDAQTNYLAAGGIAAIAAGNESTSGLRTPGDIPPPWRHPDQTTLGGVSSVVTCGASDANDQIASFSSHGPSQWANVPEYNDYPLGGVEIGLLAPDITAPGVNVKSLRHNNNTGYTTMSGTSMATPGVAGVMALILSRNPNLTPEQLCQIIEETAYRDAPQIPNNKNNIWGSGRIDAFAAANAVGYIVLENYEVVDNNNNIPEFDETLNVHISLTNSGIPDANDVIATLSCDDQYITLLESNAVFEFIDDGETVTMNNAFSFQTAANTPNLHQVDFHITIATQDNQSWSDSFSIAINAPEIRVSNASVFDLAPGGDGNGIIDPGEEIVLYIPVGNFGGAYSSPVNCVFTSNSPYATILNGADAALTGIDIGETLYPAMTVAISEMVEEATQISFNYYIQSGGYTYEGDFRIFVGGVVNAEIGEGTISSEATFTSPINIYYRSMRGQMIYTADELVEAGAIPGLPIIQFGFYVTGTPLHPLPNFRIKMKHTTEIALLVHDDGPSETVYTTAIYVPTEGGWDMLVLNTPFYWNGVDNIVVDTAFSQVTSWDGSGQMRINNYPNGYRFVRSDSGNQSDVATTNPSDYRPSVSFMLGVDPNAVDIRPRNVSVHLDGLVVNLTWDAPQTERNNRMTRNEFNPYRNPLGYNVYRNGVKLNTELVQNTEFSDYEYDPQQTYFYFVTSVYADGESSASPVATIEFIVATPLIHPEAGSYPEARSISITAPTPESTVYYTINGTEPTTASTLYNAPIYINTSTMIRARAYKENWKESEIVSAQFYILYPPSNLTGSASINTAHLQWNPPHSPLTSVLTNSRTRLSSRTKLNDERNLLGYIVYREEGEEFIRINQELISVEEYTDSDITPGAYRYFVSAQYDDGESVPTNTITVNVLNRVSAPFFTPEPGEFTEQVELLIASETEGAAIYYTLDDSIPDENANLFEGEPIILDTDTTVKAIAILTGWYDSEISEGFYEIEISSVDNNELPKFRTELLSAYPNPFNPVTNISFTLAEETKVTIDIFNILGQKINTLTNTYFQAGSHNIQWMGDNDRGNQQSSGIYFYRMTTDKAYSKIKKIVLMK